MTHGTCKLSRTAKNRDQLRNPTLGIDYGRMTKKKSRSDSVIVGRGTEREARYRRVVHSGKPLEQMEHGA